MKRSLLVVGLVVGLAALSSSASAEEKGPITTRVVEIVGRVQRPVASVEVSKARAKVVLTELRQPFIARTEEATQHDPF